MALSDAEVLEAVQRASRRAAAVVHTGLRRDLSALAAIASTAPLVGAVGTLLGIVGSFRGCGAARSTCMAATFDGLAHALAPTILAFLVAIPAWLGYRYLKSNLETLDLEMSNASVLLVNYLSVFLGVRRA
jgi:biopolymer transport protein ExbB/TolQ